MHPRSVSKPLVVSLVAAVFLALGTGYWLHQKSHPSAVVQTNAVPANPDPTRMSDPTEVGSGDTELREISPAELANLQRPPAVVQAASRPSAPTSQPAPGPEPSPYSRQLVANLTSLELGNGAIAPDRAEQWKRDLQALVGQGVGAVPAIREFLERNQDLNFTASAGEMLGSSSVRSALLNALAQIGGPEALQAQLQTLQTTTLPSEIALLSRSLEQQAPGQYRQEILSAIQDVLAMAAKGDLSGWDMAPLFQALSAGDAATAASLENIQGPWRYYTTLSLAGLAEGSGIPALTRQIQNTSGGTDFAYQMLAQMATQYPDAAAPILEQARQNRISDASWRKILAGLSGDQYQLSSPLPPGSSIAQVPGLKTYHIASGNQNFYSLPLTANPDIQNRIAFIDQLLGVTSNPTAIQALQSAKVNLSTLLPK